MVSLFFIPVYVKAVEPETGVVNVVPYILVTLFEVMVNGAALTTYGQIIVCEEAPVALQVRFDVE